MTIAKSQDAVSPTTGARLLSIRKRHGETQASFALRIGVPKSTYVSWERDEAEPPFRLIQAVRNALGGRDAADLAGVASENSALRGVDWVSLGRLCNEVQRLAARAGYDFEVEDIVEIAGVIFERGEEAFEDGLRDAEQLLRIGRRRV